MLKTLSLSNGLFALCLLCGCGVRTGRPIPDVQTAVTETQAVALAQEKESVMSVIKEHKSGQWSPELSDAEKEALFAVATDTLEWSIKGRRGSFPVDKYKITPKLQEYCATFVTFLNKGELRGCVGCLEAVEPMLMSVHRSAVNAASDSRFSYNPITLAEIPELEIHVSLLSPRRPIASIDEFKIGEHGIWLEKAGRGAVFLPEVAVEQNWTKEDTLTHLSSKAGLPPDAWKKGCSFKVFESVVLTK